MSAELIKKIADTLKSVRYGTRYNFSLKNPFSVEREQYITFKLLELNKKMGIDINVNESLTPGISFNYGLLKNKKGEYIVKVDAGFVPDFKKFIKDTQIKGTLGISISL